MLQGWTLALAGLEISEERTLFFNRWLSEFALENEGTADVDTFSTSFEELGEDPSFQKNEVTAPFTFSTTPGDMALLFGLIASVIASESALSSSPGSRASMKYSFTEIPLSQFWELLALNCFKFSSVSTAVSCVPGVVTVRLAILEAIVCVASDTAAYAGASFSVTVAVTVLFGAIGFSFSSWVAFGATAFSFFSLVALGVIGLSFPWT